MSNPPERFSGTPTVAAEGETITIQFEGTPNETVTVTIKYDGGPETIDISLDGSGKGSADWTVPSGTGGAVTLSAPGSADWAIAIG